jgi:hypothetical protein
MRLLHVDVTANSPHDRAPHQRLDLFECDAVVMTSATEIGAITANEVATID